MKVEWDKLFDKIYIINLESRKDRKKNMINVLKDLNIKNYEFVKATNRNEKTWKEALNELKIDGVSVNDFEKNEKVLYDGKELNKFKIGSPNKVKSFKGRVGVTLSHMRIYKKILDSKSKGLSLIFEDDIFFEKKNFSKNVFLKLLEMAIKDKCDVLYLGDCPELRSKDKKVIFDKKQNSLIKVEFVVCTHAYAINKKAAKIFLENILPLKRAIDDDISLIMSEKSKKINLLIFNKPIFKQFDDVKSDIDSNKFNKKLIK